MADCIEAETQHRLADDLAASGPAVMEVPSTPEISSSMLDVRAPHETIHMWVRKGNAGPLNAVVEVGMV
jgi:hypothetical protein